MVQILVIDPDPSTYEAAAHSLSPLGYTVTLSPSGTSALSAISALSPEVVVAELGLEDMSGIDVLRQIRRTRPATACVLATASGTYEAAVEALRCGVCELASKPLAGEQLVDVIERAVLCSASHGAELSECYGTAEHSMLRWADVVVRAIAAKEDPRTLAEWGREVAVSTGALRNWCRTANLSARRSVMFMRVLRAVYRQRIVGLGAEDLLNIVDRRTIAKLMMLSGGESCRLPPSLSDFLEHQQLIQNRRAIAAVRAALSRSRQLTA